MIDDLKHGYIWFLKHRAQVALCSRDRDILYIDDDLSYTDRCYIPDLRPFWRCLVPYVIGVKP
jgi:hypothetical protein